MCLFWPCYKRDPVLIVTSSLSAPGGTEQWGKNNPEKLKPIKGDGKVKGISTFGIGVGEVSLRELRLAFPWAFTGWLQASLSFSESQFPHLFYEHAYISLFETRSHVVVQAYPKFQQSSWFNLLNAELVDRSHHSWLVSVGLSDSHACRLMDHMLQCMCFVRNIHSHVGMIKYIIVGVRLQMEVLTSWVEYSYSRGSKLWFMVSSDWPPVLI